MTMQRTAADPLAMRPATSGGAAALFATSTIIWSSTWLAITFQLGSVPPEASVAYRFALAALVLGAWCLVTRRSLHYPPRVHVMLAAQGALMFGVNYVWVYKAEQHLTSGLVAVLFSTLVFMSLVGTRIAFATPITARAVLGATLGVGGVALLFAPQLTTSDARGDVVLGVALSLGATFLCTLGNLVSMKMQREQLPILPTTAWGMAYGAIVAALLATVAGVQWAFDWSVRYVGSLVYLACFGSVIAFGAYFMLLKRVGAGPSSYVAVATPVLAMVLSSALEGYRWTAAGVIGIALAVVGNVLVLRRAA